MAEIPSNTFYLNDSPETDYNTPWDAIDAALRASDPRGSDHE